MNTLFVTSPDGTRIAYDVIGEGLPLVLLHGGGYTRQNWHDVGYVKRLKDDFKVIAIEIRGNGESDKPTESACYTTDRMGQDILAVADACDAEQFTIWGFSYGGNIGRYLAAQSRRVEKLVMVGIPFGLGASGEFRQFINDFRTHWQPILEAQRDGTLDLASLSKEDRQALQEGNIALHLAWLSAMLDWGAIEPTDLRCPTLWLLGSENEAAMASFRAYEDKLRKSKVQVKVLKGVDHRGEFSEIDASLPVMLAFTTGETV
jgi:pimeloyl-ACP methyl ester carboxylesterase